MTEGTPHTSPSKRHFWMIVVAITAIVLGVFAYAYMSITKLSLHIADLTEQLASTSAALRDKTDTLSGDVSLLQSTLSSTTQEVASVNDNINQVKNQVGGVEQTVGSISGTVTTLQKLSTTDSELLKKYSKVYFLNENYTPAHLMPIPQALVYSNTRPEQYLQEASSFLFDLLAAARSAGVTFYVASGFRSFGTQETLKSGYVVTYGAGTANSFSADQGYSEHQLGTTVDFISSGFGGRLTEAFDRTPAFAWLRDNAYKYGFVLSYPKGNSFYVYEPWHWRFVGVKLATYLHDNNRYFYDMDQRDIDAYLADLFDRQ